MLLEEWLNKEVSFGDLGDVSLVRKPEDKRVMLLEEWLNKLA
jgi:crooked neck